MPVARKPVKKPRKVTKNDMDVVKVIVIIFAIVVTLFAYWVSKSFVISGFIVIPFIAAYMLMSKDYETRKR